MRRIEEAINQALIDARPCTLSVRDSVRIENGAAIYRLWYTDICAQRGGGVRVKLINEQNPWYWSRTTQSRLRALGIK